MKPGRYMLLAITSLVLLSCRHPTTTTTTTITRAIETQRSIAPACFLTVTDGAAASLGALVDQPGIRATVSGSAGNAAAIVFRYRGPSTVISYLASGEYRRQIGLKLRSADPCNLIYLMWRLDPSSIVEAQIKINPTAHDSATCGAGGYTHLTAMALQPTPAPLVGSMHEIRTEITNSELRAWIDDGPASIWALPPIALNLRGPSGIRSDNMKFELLSVLTD